MNVYEICTHNSNHIFMVAIRLDGHYTIPAQYYDDK